MDSIKQTQLGDALSDAEYLRQRTEPEIGHPDFLHLKDLYRLMQQQTRSMSGEVFDYGCGGAPYRNLFKHCTRYLKVGINDLSLCAALPWPCPPHLPIEFSENINLYL